MAKGEPGKPKGKMSSYAYFVKTCREEHNKKNPGVTVNFSEFSKKCSERWKVSYSYLESISEKNHKWIKATGSSLKKLSSVSDYVTKGED